MHRISDIADHTIVRASVVKSYEYIYIQNSAYKVHTIIAKVGSYYKPQGTARDYLKDYKGTKCKQGSHG